MIVSERSDHRGPPVEVRDSKNGIEVWVDGYMVVRLHYDEAVELWTLLRNPLELRGMLCRNCMGIGPESCLTHQVASR